MTDDIPVPIRLKRPRLLGEACVLRRRNNLAYAAERTYLYGIRFLIRYHKHKHPRDMGAIEVDELFSWLAVERHAALATQAIALNALMFLYHKYREIEPGKLDFARPAVKRRIQVKLGH